MNSIQHDKIKPYLEKHGFDQIDPDAWYPLQKWLDVLSDLAESQGGSAMMDFVSIGIKITETAVFPPEMEGAHLRDVLAGFNDVHQLNHRGDAGEFAVEFPSDNHVKITYRVPYPDDFIYGGFYGEARRWLPPGTNFIVEYDEDHVRCDHGGENTIVHIYWD